MSETNRSLFPTETEIAQRANEHWVRRGRPMGEAELDWFTARAELVAEREAEAAAEREAQLVAAREAELAAAEPAPESGVRPTRVTREVPHRPRDLSRWASEPRGYRRTAYAMGGR